MSSVAGLPQTIGDAVRAGASVHPDRVAIEDGAVRLTYGDLDEARLRAASAFLAHGIEAGDRVAIWAPNGHLWIVAALGLQTLGAILVPVNTRFKGAEAAYILNRSGARLLLSVGDFLGTYYPSLLASQPLPRLEHIVLLEDQGSSQGQHVPWSRFVEAAPRVDAGRLQRAMAAVGPEHPSDILFTSGTTGKPKGVLTTHGQNLRTFGCWSDLVGLHGDDRYLIVAPFFHAFGYKAGWLSALLKGCTILPHAVFDPAAVLDRISRDRISVLPGPPTLYQAILGADLRGRDLSSLRLAVTGAAKIPVSLVERMRTELRFDTVLTAYGLTESCGVVTMCRVGDDDERVATTSGRAIDGVEVICAGSDGGAVPIGTHGEIWVRGFNVMKGYLDDPAATAQAIDAEGWLHTGDVGTLDAEGYLTITDRKQDMFIAAGFNCYPAEIEGLMLANPGYAQVAIIGVPDSHKGEVGVAFVVPRPGTRCDEAEIIAWCRENMANYKVPRQVRVVTSLPVNAGGKVDKAALRRLFASG
jgi:acyl-CoA synthetase (AMP-forming)/AMP-acid ligase II